MFDLDACVAFITSRASKKMQDFFNERLTPLGCTRVQWIALFFLGKHESVSQSDLAKLMVVKDSTVVRLVDRMERDGYVYRVKDSNDRRITNLKLTEEGMKLRERLLPEGEKISEIFSQGISDEEFDIFMKVLDKIVSNISK